MKSSSSFLAFSAFLVIGLGLARAGEPKPALAAPGSQHRWELLIVDHTLQKANGTVDDATLRNVVEYLVELHPANVVLAPSLGSIEILDLKLA
jgi:hypothetical protein